MGGAERDELEVELVDGARGPAPLHAVSDVDGWAREPIGALTTTVPGEGMENSKCGSVGHEASSAGLPDVRSEIDVGAPPWIDR